MIRFFYRNPSGEKFEFESEEDRNKWGAPDLVRMTQEEINVHLNPSQTYQQELAELNTAWQQKVDGYNRAFAIAALVDGPSEEEKKMTIRAEYEAAKVQNNADRAALKAKYGM